MAGSHIFYFMVCKFSHEQELCQVLLLSIDKTLKVCLHYAIWLFCLTIYLRKQSCRQSAVYTGKVIEQKLELRCKYYIAITNYRLQRAIVTHYYIDNDFYQSQSIHCGLALFGVDYFIQSFNYNYNCIIVVTFPVYR